MTLYSPLLTRNPRKAVKAEYNNTNEWGYFNSLKNRMEFSKGAAAEARSGQQAVPCPTVAVVYSPTPSTVRMAASSNGEQKKALAAWLRWCSIKRSFS